MGLSLKMDFQLAILMRKMMINGMPGHTMTYIDMIVRPKHDIYGGIWWPCSWPAQPGASVEDVTAEGSCAQRAPHQWYPGSAASLPYNGDL